MTYQQWNHHYQAIPESRTLLMQPWQHEFDGPVPRPRSFSLGSRPTGTDLIQVSSKRTLDASPIILPVDSNQNYWCNKNYTSSSSSSKPKGHSRKWGSTFVFLLLIVSSLTILGWWQLRLSSSFTVDSDFQTDQVSTSSATQQEENQQSLPPPPLPSLQLPPSTPAPLIASGSQQQYYAPQQQQQTGWQQISPQQQQQQRYQHIPPASVDAHRNYPQQQYQQPYANPQYSYPPQYQQPHYGQQQKINPHQNYAQYYAVHQPEIYHQGEHAPRRSWTMKHVDNPTMPVQNDIRHHQQYHQHHQHHQHQPEHATQRQPPQRQHVQQPPPPHNIHHQQSMEPALNRQEERAEARNQARTMNPIKYQSKVHNGDDIWEEKMPRKQTIVGIPDGFKLRLEPAQFSFSETVIDKDGTIFMTSFEDDEEVTVEVIEDA